jgi:hypothetical protein
MNLRERLRDWGDDDDNKVDPHDKEDAIPEHGVNTDRDKGDDGPIDKPTT